MSDLDHLERRIRSGTDWPVPDRPPVDALDRRRRQRTARRRTRRLTTAAAVVLLVGVGVVAVATPPDRAPLLLAPAEPGEGDDLGDGNDALHNDPPPTVIDGPPVPAPPGETDLAAPGAADPILDIVAAEAPANLVEKVVDRPENSVSYGYRAGEEPAGAGQVVPGIGSNGPPHFAASVFAQTLTPESHQIYRDHRSLTSGSPVDVPDCHECLIRVIDMSPAWMQYLVLTEHAFVNLRSDEQASWSDLEAWAQRVARALDE